MGHQLGAWPKKRSPPSFDRSYKQHMNSLSILCCRTSSAKNFLLPVMLPSMTRAIKTRSGNLWCWCFHRLLQQSQRLYGTEMQLTIPKETILEIPLNVIQRATSVWGPDAELFRSHRYHKAMRRCDLFAFSDWWIFPPTYHTQTTKFNAGLAYA